MTYHLIDMKLGAKKLRAQELKEKLGILDSQPMMAQLFGENKRNLNELIDIYIEYCAHYIEQRQTKRAKSCLIYSKKLLSVYDRFEGDVAVTDLHLKLVILSGILLKDRILDFQATMADYSKEFQKKGVNPFYLILYNFFLAMSFLKDKNENQLYNRILTLKENIVRCVKLKLYSKEENLQESIVISQKILCLKSTQKAVYKAIISITMLLDTMVDIEYENVRPRTSQTLENSLKLSQNISKSFSGMVEELYLVFNSKLNPEPIVSDQANPYQINILETESKRNAGAEGAGRKDIKHKSFNRTNIFVNNLFLEASEGTWREPSKAGQIYTVRLVKEASKEVSTVLRAKYDLSGQTERERKRTFSITTIKGLRRENSESIGITVRRSDLKREEPTIAKKHKRAQSARVTENIKGNYQQYLKLMLPQGNSAAKETQEQEEPTFKQPLDQEPIAREASPKLNPNKLAPTLIRQPSNDSLKLDDSLVVVDRRGKKHSEPVLERGQAAGKKRLGNSINLDSCNFLKNLAKEKKDSFFMSKRPEEFSVTITIQKPVTAKPPPKVQSEVMTKKTSRIHRAYIGTTRDSAPNNKRVSKGLTKQETLTMNNPIESPMHTLQNSEKELKRAETQQFAFPQQTGVLATDQSIVTERKSDVLEYESMKPKRKHTFGIPENDRVSLGNDKMEAELLELFPPNLKNNLLDPSPQHQETEKISASFQQRGSGASKISAFKKMGSMAIVKSTRPLLDQYSRSKKRVEAANLKKLKTGAQAIGAGIALIKGIRNMKEVDIAHSPVPEELLKELDLHGDSVILKTHSSNLTTDMDKMLDAQAIESETNLINLTIRKIEHIFIKNRRSFRRSIFAILKVWFEEKESENE